MATNVKEMNVHASARVISAALPVKESGVHTNALVLSAQQAARERIVRSDVQATCVPAMVETTAIVDRAQTRMGTWE